MRKGRIDLSSTSEARVDERDLNTALADDLDRAFEALVTAYQPRIYRFALRYCGTREDGEEIAQDTFVRAYRALQGYGPDQRATLALQPWLYTIALNIARNRFRGKRLRSVSLDAPDGMNGAMAIHASNLDAQPAPFAERREAGSALAAAIADLPPRYRTAVILRHIEGLSYAEVAGALGQPVGTAKANVHRGIRILRESLEALEPGAATPANEDALT
jgi:RNA polymerase sigma-70 factor, ECF subfamily